VADTVVKRVIASLSAVGAERVKTDLDDIAARAEAISRMDPTVRVSADDKLALASLRAIRLELDAIAAGADVSAADVAAALHEMGDAATSPAAKLTILRLEMKAVAVAAAQQAAAEKVAAAAQAEQAAAAETAAAALEAERAALADMVDVQAMEIETANAITDAYGRQAKSAALLSAAERMLAGSEQQAADQGAKLNFAANGAIGFWHWVGIAHNLFTVFGAQLVSDTIGITAFGVAATAAIGPVITSMTTLDTSYQNLDKYQKAAALSLNTFTHSMESAKNEAGIFTVFNQGLALVESRLSSGGGVVHQATIAFQDLFAMLNADFSSAPWAALFSRQSGVIRSDMDLLFTAASDLLNVIPALMHDFNFLGSAVLTAFGGIVRVITWIGDSNPTLMKWASGTLLVAHSYSLLARHVSWLPTLGSAISTVWSKTSAWAQESYKAYQGLRMVGIGAADAATATFGTAIAFSEVAALAAGLIATLVILTMVEKHQSDATTRLIASVNSMDAAYANNLNIWRQGVVILQAHLHALVASYDAMHTVRDSYVSLSGVVDQTTRAWQSAGVRVNGYTEIMNRFGQVSRYTTPDIADTTAALAAQRAGVAVLSANLSYLATTYGMTAAQAEAAANATGVNLHQALQASGQGAAESRAKIAAYAATVQGAMNPISQVALDFRLMYQNAGNAAAQLQDLQSAFANLVTPFTSVVQDTATWRTDQVSLEAALRKSNGQIGYHTALQRAAAQALATSVNDTTTLSAAVWANTHSFEQSAAPLQREITFLESLRSHSRLVTQAIRDLQIELDHLHSKTITLTLVQRMITRGQPNYVGPGSPGHHTGPIHPSHTGGKTGAAVSNHYHAHFHGVAADAPAAARAVQKMLLELKRDSGFPIDTRAGLGLA
jgi:hypothetical protein